MSSDLDDEQYEQDDVVVDEDGQETTEKTYPSALAFILPAILILVVLAIWTWNKIRTASGTTYKPHVEPLPGGNVSKEEGKYQLRQRIAMKPGITWGPVKTSTLQPIGSSKIEMVGLATPDISGISIDSHSLRAYTDSLLSSSLMIRNKVSGAGMLSASASLSAADAPTSPEWTQQQITDYIHARLPISPQDLAGVKCGSKTDYLFFQSTRLPNADQTVINPAWGGYCIQTCNAARVSTNADDGSPSDISKKFDNRKSSDGSFLVNYELALWIDPRHNEAGYTWYCKAVPNVKTDGVGWFATVDGMYQRRLISPVYYYTNRDPFLGTYGHNDNDNDDWRLCSNSTLPIPPPSELGGISYTSSNVRWHGKVIRRGGSGSIAKYGQPWGIGYDKTDYTLVDFQMIGRYCQWVGHDDYDTLNEDSSKANFNDHGNFSRVPLADACPQQQVGEDGVKYDMRLTPSKLSCYYCPKIYEWNEETKQVEVYDTYLRGSEVDGYLCLRQCPAGMTDEQSGNLHWCIPIGIAMEALMPIITVSGDSVQ